MTRRDLLTAAELTLSTSALTAAVYGLIDAAYDPYAAVRWVPVAIVGAGTALSFVGLAAVLFVGRAALLLAGDAVRAQRDRQAPPPPSASTPLWPGNYDDQVLDAYIAERFNTRRHARQPLPPTLPMPVEELTGGGVRW